MAYDKVDEFGRELKKRADEHSAQTTKVEDGQIP